MGREHLPNGCVLNTEPDCAFGTDALLLAAFAGVRPGDRVCDLGCGCGILPLLFPDGTVADGVDCQPAAAALARRNVDENGLSHRITIYEQRWEHLTLPAGRYDAVTCNPPYFPENSGKVSDSPARRVARHETGDTLSAVAKAAARLLKNGGRFVLCHRPERLADVLETLRANGLEPKRLQFVQAHPDSPPFLLLCEALRGGKPSIRVLPPHILSKEE